MMMSLNYNYDASKLYCTQVGLTWLGDDYVRAADEDAKALAFTQAQVDAAMRHHIWQVKCLFDPKSYSRWGRIKIALKFLFGK